MRLELRHGEAEHTIEVGARPRARRSSLVVEIDEPAYDALLQADLNAFWAKARITGRFSHFAAVSEALFADLGAGRQNEFAGAATRRDNADSDATRPGVVDDLVGKLRAKHAARATRRIEEMLRMWSDETHFEHARGRLADYVIPDAAPGPWLDHERTMTEACLPRSEELQAEALAFATGREVAPDYYDTTKVEGVLWGRVLLAAYDRPVSDDMRRRFPVAMECIDRANATGRLLNACFLTMAPHHELLPHSDGNACYASWHMGLVVPEQCGLQAGDEARDHAPGKWMAFDDSWTHSAWNRSASPRVVITGWTVHPDLDDEEAAAMVDLSKLLSWGI